MNIRHSTLIGREKEAGGAEAQPCLTRFELADLLRISLRTVDRMIANDEIPIRRVRGKAVRFLRSDVERFLKAEGGSQRGG